MPAVACSTLEPHATGSASACVMVTSSDGCKIEFPGHASTLCQSVPDVDGDPIPSARESFLELCSRATRYSEADLLDVVLCAREGDPLRFLQQATAGESGAFSGAKAVRLLEVGDDLGVSKAVDCSSTWLARQAIFGADDVVASICTAVLALPTHLRSHITRKVPTERVLERASPQSARLLQLLLSVRPELDWSGACVPYDLCARFSAAVLCAPSRVAGLCTLSLCQCQIDDASVASLARALPLLPSLRALQLRGNRFGPSGASALADALRASCCCDALQELDLRGNALGCEGLDVLLPALMGCAALRAADLSHCDIAMVAPTAFPITSASVLKLCSPQPISEASKDSIVGSVLSVMLLLEDEAEPNAGSQADAPVAAAPVADAPAAPAAPACTCCCSDDDDRAAVPPPPTTVQDAATQTSAAPDPGATPRPWHLPTSCSASALGGSDRYATLLQPVDVLLKHAFMELDTRSSFDVYVVITLLFRVFPRMYGLSGAWMPVMGPLLAASCVYTHCQRNFWYYMGPETASYVAHNLMLLAICPFVAALLDHFREAAHWHPEMAHVETSYWLFRSCIARGAHAALLSAVAICSVGASAVPLLLYGLPSRAAQRRRRSALDSVRAMLRTHLVLAPYVDLPPVLGVLPACVIALLSGDVIKWINLFLSEAYSTVQRSLNSDRSIGLPRWLLLLSWCISMTQFIMIVLSFVTTCLRVGSHYLVKLTHYVLRRACPHSTDGTAAAAPPLHLAIDLTGNRVTDQGVLRCLTYALLANDAERDFSFDFTKNALSVPGDERLVARWRRGDTLVTMSSGDTSTEWVLGLKPVRDDAEPAAAVNADIDIRYGPLALPRFLMDELRSTWFMSTHCITKSCQRLNMLR